MEIKQIKFMGTMKDDRIETENSRIGLYAVQVTGHGGYQAEFFVLANTLGEAGELWQENGSKIRTSEAEAIFN